MSESRPKRLVEDALISKGFRSRESDHTYYIYHSLAGLKTLVKTKTSHGNKPKTISGDLLAAMSQQCRLSKMQFLQLIDCPMTREDYEAVLQRNGLL